MPKLFKRNGVYYADLRGSGGGRPSLKTSDKKVARAKLRQLEFEQADPAAYKTQGLVQALDHLIKVAMPVAGRSQGTINCYSQKAQHLVRLLGEDMTLRALTRDDVQGYIETRLQEGAARSTVSKELVTLRRAMTEAKDRKLFFGEPSAVVPRFETNSKPKTRWLPPGELSALIGSLNLPKRKLWAMIAAFTGCRDSELEALRWENVHLSRGVIRILTTKTKGADFWRDVPIMAQLKPWLEGFAEDAGPVVEPWGNVRRDLHAACKRVGIDPCSPNDLRRTFASYMLQAGVPVFPVSRMMGHKSTRMVEQVYGQLGLNTFQGAGEICAIYVSETCAQLTKSGEIETGAENLKPSQTAQEGDLRGSREVPGDRVELPTRGFSVPDLKVLSGGKRKRKRTKAG